MVSRQVLDMCCHGFVAKTQPSGKDKQLALPQPAAYLYPLESNSTHYLDVLLKLLLNKCSLTFS